MTLVKPADTFRLGPPVAPPWQMALMEQFSLPVTWKNVEKIRVLFKTWNWNESVLKPGSHFDRRILSLALLALGDGAILKPSHLAVIQKNPGGKNTQGPNPKAEIRTIPDLLALVMDDERFRDALNKEVLPRVDFPLFLLKLPSLFYLAPGPDDEVWFYQAPGAPFSIWRLRMKLPQLGPVQLTVLKQPGKLWVEFCHGMEMTALQLTMAFQLISGICSRRLKVKPQIKARLCPELGPILLEGNEWLFDGITGGFV